jgi:RES domain-containing protein
MLIVWRLVTARFAKSAFSGEGARLYGGRWNRKGVSLVYTSESQSLAMLEMLVQDEPRRARCVVIDAHIPKGVAIDRIKAAELPPDWREIGGRDKLQEIGSRWATGQGAAVLAVPSAVVPSETNYLLNPLHPDFRRIKTGKPQTVQTDPRLLRF